MKIYLFILAYCLVSNSVWSQSWSLAWKDEFKREGLPDTTYWNIDEGNQEKIGAQFYVAGNLLNTRIASDHLFLQMRKNNDSRFPFSSAHIHTKNKISFLHGRLEIKAKMPRDTNVLATIGLLSNRNDSASLQDYAEILCSNQMRDGKGNLEAKVYLGSDNRLIGNEKPLIIEKPYVDFHLFAFEWDEESVRVLFDDRLYYQYKRNGEAWPFDKPMYLFINMKIAEEAGQSKAIDENFYQQLVIDYVRYFRKHEKDLSVQK